MRTLKAAGYGRRKAIVLAALKVRRNRRFPESGNQAGRIGTDEPEPRSEPTDNDGAASQVSGPSAVPGTDGNPSGTVQESTGTGFPLSRGEPVPDRTSDDLAVERLLLAFTQSNGERPVVVERSACVV